MESFFIKRYSANNKTKGYNLTNGGDGIFGYKLTEEQKKRLSESRKGELHPNFGKKLSLETRQKMSEIRKGHRPYNNKVIVQLSLSGEYINTFESALKAADSLGKYNSRSNITKACKNGSTALGFKWKYLIDYQ